MTDPADAASPGVLIVDDESEIVDLLTLYLGRQGYRVRGATSAEAGLAVVRDDPGIGVLITDLRLPGVSGPALAEALFRGRTEAEALEVVLITGAGDGDPALEAFRDKAFAVLRKPFRPSAVAAAVAGARAAAERRRGGAARADDAPAAPLHRLREAIGAVQAEAAMLAAGPVPTEAELHRRAGRIRDAAAAMLGLLDQATAGGAR